MKNRDNSIRAAESYDVAFRVGVVGTVVLTIAALLGDALAWLVALAAWSMITLFVLPWLHEHYSNWTTSIPDWCLKGPHQ